MQFSMVQTLILQIIPLLFAITLHEVAHGYAALMCGDDTAKFSGRLSLDPLKHIDLFGTIILPILMLIAGGFIFGWAKPVPVDPRNFRHPRRDMAWVGFAGPLANFVMAVLWGLVAKGGIFLAMQGNLSVGQPLQYVGEVGISMNVMLGVLNLFPIPPLDGSKILSSILPARTAYQFSLLEPYGIFILIALLAMGILTAILSPIFRAITMALVGWLGL